MTPTGIALLGYAAWTLLLVISLAGLRSLNVLRGARAANSYAPSGEDMDPFGKRLTRAHANCFETLPVAGAVLLYAIATAQTALTDPLALTFLAARLAQSAAHLISTSNAFVLIRFAFFAVQLMILVWWIARLSGLV